jgi:hypothetical protein
MSGQTVCLPGASRELIDRSIRSVRLTALIAFSFAAYPPLQAALLGGTSAITTFFAADAFYYLSIAVNSTFGRYTFDGRAMTNGFHPLWQVLLQLVVGHLSVRSGTPPLIASFSLSVLFASLGLACVAAGLALVTEAVWPSLLLFPGTYYLLACQIDPRFGSVWSFMNGMESPCSLLFFGVLCYFVFRQRSAFTTGSILIVSLISLGIVFSRLDDVFLPVSFGVWLLLRNRRSAVLYGIPLFLGLSAYLIFNRLMVGTFLPTSGAVKARGLGVLQNIAWMLYDLAPFTSSTLYRLLPQLRHAEPGLNVEWRIAQTVIPMLVSCILLKDRRLLKWVTGEHKGFFTVLYAYVLLKGAYNFLFVPWYAEGHWYFTLSIVIVDMTACLAAFRVAQQYTLNRRLLIGTLLAACWLSSVSLIWRVVNSKYQNTVNVEMLRRGPEIRDALARNIGQFRIIEFDDGILNYSLSTPTLSGFGLASDPASAKSIRAKKFLLYAASQGYNVIASANYPIAGVEGMSSDQLRDSLHHSVLAGDSDLEDFNFKVAYVDPNTHAYFIQFNRRPAD